MCADAYTACFVFYRWSFACVLEYMRRVRTGRCMLRLRALRTDVCESANSLALVLRASLGRRFSVGNCNVFGWFKLMSFALRVFVDCLGRRCPNRGARGYACDDGHVMCEMLDLRDA